LPEERLEPVDETAVPKGRPVPWLRYVFGAGATPSRHLLQLAMPQIVVACALTDKEVGAIGAGAAALGFTAGLVVAWAADRHDLRAATVSCLLLVTASVSWLAGSVTVPAYCAALWCSSVALKVVSGGTFFKVVRGDADPDRAIVRYQFVNVVVVTVLPALAGLALLAGLKAAGEGKGWRLAVLVVCWAQLGWLFLVARTPTERVAPRHRPNRDDYRRLLTHGRMFALVFLGALHVGADCAAFYWVVLLAKRRFGQVGYVELGLLYAAINSSYLVGRLIMLRLRGRALNLGHVASLAPLAALALAAMAFWSPSYGVMMAQAWLAYLPLGCNWPILIGRAVDWFPDAPSAAIGLLDAWAAFGVMAALYFVGMVSDASDSLAIGFLVPVGMLLALAVGSAALHLATRERAEDAS